MNKMKDSKTKIIQLLLLILGVFISCQNKELTDKYDFELTQVFESSTLDVHEGNGSIIQVTLKSKNDGNRIKLLDLQNVFDIYTNDNNKVDFIGSCVKGAKLIDFSYYEMDINSEFLMFYQIGRKSVLGADLIITVEHGNTSKQYGYDYLKERLNLKTISSVRKFMSEIQTFCK